MGQDHRFSKLDMIAHISNKGHIIDPTAKSVFFNLLLFIIIHMNHMIQF